jgi:hypothetical protein
MSSRSVIWLARTIPPGSILNVNRTGNPSGFGWGLALGLTDATSKVPVFVTDGNCASANVAEQKVTVAKIKDMIC